MRWPWQRRKSRAIESPIASSEAVTPPAPASPLASATSFAPNFAKADTLRRTKLRPMGGAVVGALRQDPGDQLTDLYDPDSIARQFYRPAAEIAQFAFVPTRLGNRECDPPVPHRLQLVEQVKGVGKREWKLRERVVRTAQELRDLSETREFRASRFYEATGGWRPSSISQQDYARYVTPFREAAVVNTSKAIKAYRESLREGGFEFGDSEFSAYPNVMGAMDQEFVPVVGGPYYRQLYLYAHWEQTSKAFEMKNHSELAKCAIDINTDFTLGRGINWKISNDRVRAIWSEFWDRNKMEQRLRTLSDDFTWQGELLIRKFSPLRGFLAIRSLDPGAIYEIVTNPQDVEEVFFYHYQAPTPFQQPYTNFKGHNLNVPLSQYVIQQYAANEIYHLKNNVSSTEKWGRSDFFVSLGTLKRHRDWSNAATLKDLLQANLVWTITITGDDADVQAFLSDPANAQLPAYGGTWVQNTALKLDLLHEDVAAQGRASSGNTGAFLTALFATSQQHPVSYYNITGSGAARATALVQSEPVVKKIVARQQAFRSLLDHLFLSVMEEAVQGGRIDPSELRHDDADPEWMFPTLYEEDRSSKMQALGAARTEGVISHRTESIQMAQELGLDAYDYDTEQGEIKKEIARGFAPPQSLAPPTPPLAPPTDASSSSQPAKVDLPSLQDNQQERASAGLKPLELGSEPQAGKERVHERIKGADARHNFRQQQREADLDRKFLEAAILNGASGQVRLPSGAFAVIEPD